MYLIKLNGGGDPFDPNNWEQDDHECRIYADETLEVYAVVDWIDYIELCKHKWSIHTTRVHSGLTRKKFYLKRSLNELLGPEGEPYISPFTGKLVRNRHRIVSNLFLHQAVMKLSGKLPPTPDHKIIDHGDRDTMNCRRNNLNWVTHKYNSNNRIHVNGWISKPGIHVRES